MKKIIALILLVAFSTQLYSQKFGYNEVGHNWKELFTDKTYYNAVVAIYKNIPDGEKVMRWPDGQEGIENGERYDSLLTAQFIQFCRDACISEITYRANLLLMDDAIVEMRHLERFLDIILIEAHNEPYLENVIAPKNVNDWFMSRFNTIAYHRMKAREYGDMVASFIERIPEHIDKIGFSIPVPKRAIKKHQVWYEELNWLPLNNIIVHVYGNPTTNWLVTDFEDMASTIEPRYKVWVTEYNAIHFGLHGYTDHASFAFTDKHRNDHRLAIKKFREMGVELVLLHKSHQKDTKRLFSRYVYVKGVIQDRMKGW